MLAELKFVMGAVSKKDFIPALTHFRIENGTVRSYNGTLALCTPIALNINCAPKAEPLIKAIQNCEDTVSISMTPTGRLSVRSGAFKALIECVDEETPHVQPEGQMFAIDGEALLTALKTVAPFIGDDASRKWSNGVFIKGQSAFATNNICIIEYWIGSDFPLTCNLPKAAVREMIRINEAPISAQANENNITFHYTGDRWIRCQLLNTDWPDLSLILNIPSTQVEFNQALFPALVKLKPFVDKMGRIYFLDGVVSTTQQVEDSVDGDIVTTLVDGAACELADFHFTGIYHIDMLNLLDGIAQTIDFAAFPKACLFMGDRLRGAIIGMRP